MKTLIITIGKIHYHITLNKKTGILNATVFENCKRLGVTELSQEEVKGLISEFLAQGK